jgi:hypothetical protein
LQGSGASWQAAGASGLALSNRSNGEIVLAIQMRNPKHTWAGLALLGVENSLSDRRLFPQRVHALSGLSREELKIVEGPAK